MDELNKNKSKNSSHDTGIKQVVTYDDSEATGEFYTLDDSWVEIPNYKSDKYRLGVGSKYSNTKVRLFVCINTNCNIKIVENKYLLFDRNDWIELRCKRGDNKYKPLSVDKNGTIWIGEKQHGTSYRVYIKS
jgi:hypothetical protein